MAPEVAEIVQLAGGLAHEIRNPLSTMRLNLELLAEELQGAAAPRDRRILQKIDRVRREAQRLENILEDFLRFARVEVLKRVPTDLNALIDDLRDFIEPQATTQGVIIRTQFDESLPAVAIDEDLFKQALLNLILNALHAMPDGGELILTTRREPAAAVVEVIDTGSGIAEEHQAEVFKPYFSTRPGGSGLGLPTARRILQAHGGTIDLASAVGKGTRFTLRLPLTPPPDDHDDSPSREV
jgi:two-component system sensor histidine kinase HydH